VLDTIVDLADGLPARLDEVRRRGGEHTHDVRVRLRRLRSILATFAPVLDLDVRGLRAELGWLFGELGGARDAEVLAERLQGPEPADDAADHLIAREIDEAAAVSTARAVEALASARCSALQDRLRDLPGVLALVPTAADPDARACVARQHRRLHRRLAHLTGRLGVDYTAEDLHEARKAAKQLRYSIDPLLPRHEREARELARRVEAVQKSLGDVQDVALTRRLLRRLSDAGVPAPQELALGRLDERERRAAKDALRRFDRDRAGLLDDDPHWLG
jgi:CHAD domain-containing protein